MIVHQVFALIFEEKVQNVFVCENYEMANYIARASFGNEAFAVDCLQYPCAVGDAYRNGIFYRMNENTGVEFEIEYVPTQEEQVRMLTYELNTSNAIINALLGEEEELE